MKFKRIEAGKYESEHGYTISRHYDKNIFTGRPMTSLPIWYIYDADHNKIDYAYSLKNAKQVVEDLSTIAGRDNAATSPCYTNNITQTEEKNMNETNERTPILEEIAKRINERLNVPAKAISVKKNNNVVLNGINVGKQDNDRISAVLYIDHEIDGIINGITAIEDVVDDIIERYNNSAFGPNSPDLSNVDEFLSDKERVLANVHRALINTEMNDAMLNECPHKTFLDLTIVYRINIGENASVRITNDVMKLIGVTIDELDFAALQNDRATYDYSNIVEMLRAMNPMIADSMEGLTMPMYVATKQNGYYGASIMCDFSYMNRVAKELGGDFLIIPSSVHEIIMLPMTEIGDDISIEYVKNMVGAINGSEVRDDEVLSYNVYKFDSIQKNICYAMR